MKDDFRWRAPSRDLMAADFLPWEIPISNYDISKIICFRQGKNQRRLENAMLCSQLFTEDAILLR